jgi:hypothetical protein
LLLNLVEGFAVLLIKVIAVLWYYKIRLGDKVGTKNCWPKEKRANNKRLPLRLCLTENDVSMSP